MADDAKQVKVNFPFESGMESMWADECENGRYRLDNVPLFAYGISYGDEFLVERQDDNSLNFKCVVRRNGDSTYRVTFNERYQEDEASKALINQAVAGADLVDLRP